MDLISIFDVLSRRRVWVGLACLLAIVVGVFVAFRVTLGFPPTLQSRQYHVSQASIHVLVDTPSSQVADLDPPVGAEVLNQRASLFTNLIATGPVLALIAANTHVPADQLSVIAPSTTSTLVPTPLATTATANGVPSAPYQVTVRADETLPILSIETQAPDAAGAAVLANGTFAALREYLDEVATAQKIPENRKPVVSALGRAISGEVQRGPSPMYALLAALFVFGLACSAIVLVEGLVRTRRAGAPVPAGEPLPIGPLARPRATRGVNGTATGVNGTTTDVPTARP